MDEAVLALEGPVAPMSCFVDDREGERVLCSHLEDESHEACATRVLWMRVQGGVIGALQRTTLQELVEFGTPHPSESAPAPVGAALPQQSAA
jgi:DNA-binding IscR family transcriptional regulator